MIPTDYLYSMYSRTTKLEYNISLQIRKTAEWKVLPEKEHIVHAHTAFQNSNTLPWAKQCAMTRRHSKALPETALRHNRNGRLQPLWQMTTNNGNNDGTTNRKMEFSLQMATTNNDDDSGGNNNKMTSRDSAPCWAENNTRWWAVALWQATWNCNGYRRGWRR